MSDRYEMSWPEVYARLGKLKLPRGGVFGVPRGGAVVAGLTGRAISDAAEAASIVDDIVDSGRTRERFAAMGLPFYALVDKTKADRGMGWVVFPWESRDETADIEDTVVRQLEFVGEDARRAGLVRTPHRVVAALKEMTAGYTQDPAAILAVQFEAEHSEMVIVRDVPFTSLCEHHMLPFHGTVAVGYVPGKSIVGLSKIPRVVHCFASRLQVQERLTGQIGQSIEAALKPLGVGVYVRAHHTCMGMRGVKSPGVMVTSYVSGVFRSKAAARAEFMAVVR